MFTFGVMIGFGLPKASESAAVSGHEAGHASGHGEASPSSRSPASVGGKGEAKVPGASLRKAFRESKQEALTEMVLRSQESEQQRPNSVPDAAAHLEANSQWARQAGSGEDQVEQAVAAKAREAELAREKAGPSNTVKSLFERKPSSVDRFSPISGQFTVQMGSYSTEDESKAKVSVLRKAGFNDAYYEIATLPNGERWYRVGLGSFTTSAWAKKAGERVIKRKLASDFIVRRVP